MQFNVNVSKRFVSLHDCVSAWSGIACGASPIFFASVTAASVHLMRTIANVDLSDPANCKSGFDASAKGTGAMLGMGVAADVLVKAGYIL